MKKTRILAIVLTIVLIFNSIPYGLISAGAEVISDTTYSVRLTWQTTPRDLDSHLRGQDSAGNDFHVYYSNKTVYDTNDKLLAKLDVDDTSGYGPENTTIFRPIKGVTFSYFVHNFSGESPIAGCGALVQLYKNNTLLAEFTPPGESNNGRYWNIFQIKDGKLSRYNTIEDSETFTNAEAEVVRDYGTPDDLSELVNYKCDGVQGREQVTFKKAWLNSTENANTVYNHELGKFCAYFCMFGYSPDKSTQTGKNTWINGALETMGFTVLSSNMNAARDEENYFIAAKTVYFENVRKNILFIGTIGSNKKQWYSNFDPWGYGRENGKGIQKNQHSGFIDARNFVAQKISSIVADERYGFTKSNTILLFTGHSRGAATANLLAASAIVDNKWANRDSIYAYTFATPNNTPESDYNNARYNCIFNIVNPEDMVTHVMLRDAWGYHKYGKNLVLPTKNNTKSSEYKKLKDAMNVYYQRFVGSKYEPYTRGEAATHEIIKKFNTNVKTIGDFYNKTFQYTDELSLLYKKDTAYRFFQYTLLPYVSGVDKDGAQKEIINVIVNTILHNANQIFLTSNYTFFVDILTYFADPDIDFSIIPLEFDLGIGGNFTEAHHVQTYCAYMQALTAAQITKERSSKYGKWNCPVDIEIYDNETDELVGRIVNNVIDPEIAAKENAIVMGVDGDEKTYYLPSDGDYTVKIIGNEAGTADYAFGILDEELQEQERVNYFDMAIEGTETNLTTVIDPSTTSETVQLTGRDDEIVPPDERFETIVDATRQVEVQVIGSGKVVGDGIKVSGDYVELSAVSQCSDFLGWYAGDELLSDKEIYRFRVTDDIALVAKFTAGDHHFSEVNIEPTCSNEGVRKLVCDNCGAEEILSTTQAQGHSYVFHSAKPTTCTENGWHSYLTCSRCSYSTYSEQPAYGHNFAAQEDGSNVVNNGDGTHTVCCANCGVVGETTVHIFEDGTNMPATCTDDACFLYICRYCDAEQREDYEGTALGHSIVNGSVICDTCGRVADEEQLQCVEQKRYISDKGETIIIAPNFPEECATVEAFFWYSDNEKVATVEDGEVSLVGKGTATITAVTPAGYCGRYIITVNGREELMLNDTATIEITAMTSVRYFAFVPQVSANYTWRLMADVDTYGYICDSHMNLLAANEYEDGQLPHEVSHYMQAGETYLLGARFVGDAVGTFAAKIENTKAIAIDLPNQISGYFGESRTVPLTYEPYDATLGELTWISCDEGIATVSSVGVLTFVCPGVTEMIVETENGIADYAVVTVKEYTGIEINETKTVDITEGGQYECFSFTPAVDGRYALYSVSDNNTYAYLYNSTGILLVSDSTSGEGNNFRIEYNMVAGQQYIFKVKMNSSSATGSFDVKLVEMVKAESVSIDQGDSIKGYPGDSRTLSVSFGPNDAISESCTWQSSNTTVASVSSKGVVSFLAVGEAEITATSENGLTDTCTIYVTDYPEIHSGDIVSVNIDNDNKNAYFKFTPEVSDTYIFTSISNSDTYGYLLDSEGNALTSNDDGGTGSNFKIEYALEAGQTYIYRCCYLSNSATGSFDVELYRIVVAESLTFEEGATYIGREGDRVTLTPKFLPNHSKTESVSWSSSDEFLATVNNGTVSLLSEGTATITATSENGLTATCEVTITGYEHIHSNETKTATIAAFGERAYFKFIPETSGTYSFFSSSNEDTYGYIYDADMNQLSSNDDGGEGNNFEVSYRMTAGTTYILVAKYFGSTTGSFNVSLSKAPDATAISIQSTYHGYVGDNNYLYVSYEPYDAAQEDITWASNNESVVTVTSSGEMDFVAEGEAIITATTSNGLTANCVVTISEPAVMYEDTPIRVQIEDGQSQTIIFTPEENGNYIFRCNNYSNSNRANLSLKDTNGSYLASESTQITAELIGGKTYRITTYYWSYSGEGDGSYDITVSRTVPATGLTPLDDENVIVYVNTQAGVRVKFEPWNTEPENLTWTSSDETIIKIDDSYFSEGICGCHFYALTCGVATITATSESGLTAEYIITVTDWEKLALEETKSAIISKCGEYAYFKFVPEEDGYYAFYSDTDLDTYGHIYDENWNELASNDDSDYAGNFKVKYYMKSGTTYILGAHFCDSSTVGSFDVAVEKTKSITKLEVVSLPNKMEYIKGFVSGNLNYTGLKLRATWSDGSTSDWEYDYDWKIDDEYIYIYNYDVDETGNVELVCGGASVTIELSIIENPVDHIELVSGTAKNYIENYNGYIAENDDGVYFCYNTDYPDDAEIRIVYKDGTSTTAKVGERVDGYDIYWGENQYYLPWVVGTENESTVSYLGNTVTLPITVIENPIDRIEINSAPTREYIYGDTEYGYLYSDGEYGFFPTDLTGLSFTVYYTDGTSTTFTNDDIDEDGRINGYDYDIQCEYHPEIGDVPVTFEYLGKTANYTVMLKESPVASITVTKNPSKTEYDSNYSPIFDGAEITFEYKDGTIKTVTLSNDNTSYSTELVWSDDIFYHIDVDGYQLSIENYYDWETEEQYYNITYCGCSTKLDNIFTYTEKEVIDVQMVSFDRKSRDMTVSVRYADESIELLEVKNITAEGPMNYGKTDNGLLYYWIESEFIEDGSIIGDCEIHILGQMLQVSADQRLFGDANGDGSVDIKDVVLIRQHIVNLDVDTGVSSVAVEDGADANGDGSVDIKDVVLIRQYIVNLDVDTGVSSVVLGPQ